MEMTKFDRVIGRPFKSGDNDIVDPWSGLAAAMLKQALYDFLKSKRKKPNQEVLIWLQSEEAAWVSEIAGVNYNKIRRVIELFGSETPSKERLIMKYKIKEFQDRYCTYNK